MPSEHDGGHHDVIETPRVRDSGVNAGESVTRIDGGLSGGYAGIIGHRHGTGDVDACASDEQALASVSNVSIDGVATQAALIDAVRTTRTQGSQVAASARCRAGEDGRAER